MNSPPPPGSEFTAIGIASLPPELLTEIFGLAQSKLRVIHKVFTGVPHVPIEVVLSHVSSSWRSFVLGNCMLWRRIDICSLRSLDRVSHYLQRSGTQVSLDICINLYDEDGLLLSDIQRERETIVQLIANAVLPFIHRAHTLSVLTYYEHTAIMLLSKFIDPPVSDLKSLLIQFGSAFFLDYIRDPGVRFFNRGLPQLTFLETDLPYCLPPMALQNLTTLSLNKLDKSSDFSYLSVVAMITASPCLSHLLLRGYLDLTSSDGPPHSSWPGFVMNNLKSLRLEDRGMFAFKILLPMFAPNLESLWLEYSFDSVGHLFDAPYVAHPSRFPTLKYLTMPRHGFSHHTKFSKVFPTITHLHLYYLDSFYDELADFLSREWIYLHTLVIGIIEQSEISRFHGALCHFLPYRRRAGYPIRKLLVDKDLLKRLKEKRPDMSGEVEIEILNLETYSEHWWTIHHGHDFCCCMHGWYERNIH